MNPLNNGVEIQRDIHEWFGQFLGMASTYPLRFALAAGIVLLIFGLLAFKLAATGEQNQAAGDWLVAEIRARRRGAILLSLFGLLGILVGVQFARFTIAAHSAVPEPVAVSRNPADQVKVWEDPHHGVYHCPGSGWFGKTRGGRVATLRQAQYEGYRPYGRPCPLNQMNQTTTTQTAP